MNKYFLLVIILLSFLFLPLSLVFAQELKSSNLVVLPKDQIVNENYFASGETVSVAGTVNGDVYAAGGMVNIEGTVNGDILVAGGQINIRGEVLQDVRVAGGTINIAGTVGGNITVVGGNITISDSAVVKGSVVTAGGSVAILSPVAKSITAAAGQLTIGNTVGGNVLAGTGQLSLTPNSAIEGTLTYYSEDPAQIQNGATVSGTIKHEIPPVTKKDAVKAKETARNVFNTFHFMWTVMSLLSTFIIGTILSLLAPLFMKKTTETIERKPWVSLGIGALIMILTPLLVLALLVSLVGIPLSFITLALYFIYIYISKIPVALFLGQKVLAYINPKNKSVILHLFIGLVIYAILTSIRIIGPIVSILTLLIGVGALFITKREFFITLKAKNSI